MASTPDNLYVTYVDVDCELLKIWGQRDRTAATYIERQLQQLLPEFNRSPCPNPSKIHKGMPCFAKYTDDHYYRARVLSEVINDSVGVLFVDYGNRDVIKLSNIRIQEGLEGNTVTKMLKQAEEYYLARVAAPSFGWTKEIISEIRRDICYKEFLYQVVTKVGDQKIIEMQYQNDDFSNYLVKKQLAIPLSLPVQSQMILSYCRLVPTESKLETSSREMPRVNFCPSVPPPNMRTSFKLSSAPNEGMMQMNYGKSSSQMNFPQPPQSAPQRNMNPTVSQNIPKNSFYQSFSPPSEMQNPSLPVNSAFNPILNSQSNPLQDPDPFNSNSNIIQLLAQQVKQYIAQDNARTESEAERTLHYYVNSVLEVGNTHNVVISFIEDGPWSFSVQLLSSENELRKLMGELAMTELVPLKPPIILGYPCIASSVLYGNLCRGVIVSISRSAMKVYFVDFGNTEDLPSSSIYELPVKFFKIGVLSQKFSLSGLQNVVYSDVIKKLFKEVVQDELLMLRVMSLEDDNLPTCELYLKDKNIKRILNEKIREVRSSIVDDFPKVGETENVVVTWVVNPQKFFIQLRKRDGDLNALKRELAEVETKGQRLTYQQLRVGFKCVCRYETDGLWYRAVITSVDSENSITVFYVDYGNTETVNLSSLRRIEPSGLVDQLCNQAIQCSLKGFEDKSFDQEIISKLEMLILEKFLKMTVVSLEKELLCVQLFDEGKDISTMLLLSTAPKSEPVEAPSQGLKSLTSKEPNTAGRKFPARESYDKKESRSSRGDKIRNEESWRSDNGKDNYWNESVDQNSSKTRNQKQNSSWDSNNNTNMNTSYYISSNNNNNYSSFKSKQEGGYENWGENPRFERSRGTKRDRNRDNWEERKDSNFGERKKMEENCGSRDTFGSREGKRFDRSRGRDPSRGEPEKRSEIGRDRKLEERKSTRKPIRKEDAAPPGSKFEEKTIQMGSQEKGIVTYFFSPHEFFVQLLAEEKEFKKMMEDIQTYYSDKYSVRDPVQAGDIVIAQFSLDKVLYRAEVVKPSPVTVRYVDYGNQEPVGPKSTWTVDKQFLKLPKQVVKCRLSNVEPTGSDWPPPGSQIDKFFMFPEYNCTFLGLEGDMYEIMLEDASTGKDVARELIAAGLARSSAPKLDVPESDFSLLPKQVLRLHVSHVDSSSKFYVILNPKGLEAIQKEVKAFSEDKRGLTPLRGDSSKPGTVCLMKTGDDVWRRGSIVKTDGNKILVWLSDRGDCVEVTADEVMSLPDHLKVFQPQVVECSLHGNLIGRSEEEFKEAIELKEVLVSVASAEEGSLSVVLYDEDGKKFDFQNREDFPQEVEPIGHLPIISQKLPIVISHSESPHEIYIQRSEDGDELNSLIEKMSDFYSREDVEPEGREGELVAGKSAVYDAWYRGRVAAASEEGLEVFFIDYGNKEVLPRENVKKLDGSFARVRGFSKKVALDVKFPEEKTEEINKKITEICQGKNVFGYFANVNGELVAEFSVDGEIITEKLASSDRSAEGKVKFGEFSPEEKTESETRTVPEPPTVGVPETSDLRVIVTHIDSPNRFWVHSESLENDMHLFQEELQKKCEVLPDKKNVRVGDVAAAVYSDMWYRAKVTNVDGDKLTVQFIDYGNTFVVDLSCNSVKELPEELLRVPVFATPFALAGTWSENSRSKFEEIILQNEEPVKVVVLEQSDPVRVDLYQNGQSIAEMLKNRVREEETESGGLCAVYITHSQSPNDFYVQRETCEETLKKLRDRLADTSAFATPSSIEENEIYAAKFPDDGAWYRGRVTKVEGEEVEVYFIDYGNTSNVTEVKCLPEDLVDIPNLAENYSLAYGDACDAWSDAACEKFSELADGRKLRMKVVANRVKKPVVKLFDGEKNVSEELEKVCEPDGRSEVYVSHALSPTDFYIQYAEDEEHKVIAEKLENGDEAEDLTDPEPGTLCQARFVEDGCWYRAKVLRNLEDRFEVFFVDFGNNSVATELKKLPPEIAEIPPRAVRCSLNLPETNIPESVKEEFINLTAGGTTAFRALIIASDEVTTISLKLDGRILEETLSLDAIPSDEGFPHSVESETDDGKNSKKNLMGENFLISNLADDLRNGEESVSNETDEEKRVKIAISGLEGSEGFKSDDEKGIEGSVSSGFVNATDNELMDEVSTFEDASPESSVEEIKTDVALNGVSDAVEESQKTEDERGSKKDRKKVHKIVLGSISRGEDEVTETSPTQYEKVSLSEKVAPGSISKGISLESVPSESEPLEDSSEKLASRGAPDPPEMIRRRESAGYVKIDPNDRVVPGCISMGDSLHCSPGGEKVPESEKIVPGAVNGSVENE